MGLVRVHRLVATCLLLPTLALAQRVDPSAVTNPQPGGVSSPLFGRNGLFDLTRARADTDSIPRSLFGPGSDLGLQLSARIQPRLQHDRDERCNASVFASLSQSCSGTFLSTLDFQGALKSKGTIANKVDVDVDYDSQREFDASNNISLVYRGGQNQTVQRLELGNVSFTPPPSRFITAGIPSGNYGVQGLFAFGRMNVHAIAAVQKGNVVQDREFLIGDRTTSTGEIDIEDWRVEPRRFFFTVDPRLFSGAFPNIDLLDRAQLRRLASQLPDTLRPTRVRLYRLQYGTQPKNPNGPRFRLLNDPSPARQTYDLLIENVDYYIDPSLLWVALVRPLNLAKERLVVAFNVRLHGRDTVWTSTGGNPDIQATVPDQYANLVWDPDVEPGSGAFPREIRSVYRIAGEDLVRKSLKLRVLAGAGQLERPIAGVAQTYLRMFGLAQVNNDASFDVENRLWPRPTDPNFNFNAGGVSGGPLLVGGTRLIHDYFVFMPSVRPFAGQDSGLVVAGNPTNEAIYDTPGEYLVSSGQHPPTVYHLRARYETEFNVDRGTIVLGSVQLRRLSERVVLDGVELTRDIDYRMDYDLGQLTFFRPDTLFTRQRNVRVRYEENPLFVQTPTNIFGITSELPFSHGSLNFIGISQSQQSPFTLPQLGFEPASSLVAGVNGQFGWDVPAVTNALKNVASAAPNIPAHLNVFGEMAASRPQLSKSTQAYLETFESAGGISVNLSDQTWYYSSLPAIGQHLPPGVAGILDPSRISTMAWQNNGTGADGNLVVFRIGDIDPLANLVGAGIAPPEQALWLTLYPLAIGGNLDRVHHAYQWQVTGTAPGRRFRSVRTVLSPTGLDLSNSEYLQFWTLIDTSVAGRARNPMLIFDIGDVSENSYTFSPETLYIRPRQGGGVDSVYGGKRAQGLDHLDSERDPFTHAFNESVNDTGLPGDVVDSIVVVDLNGAITKVRNFAICQGVPRTVLPLGDTHINCTVRNNRLDEEDIDLDGALNIDSAHRESEQILRYVIDLSDPARFTRVGKDAIVADTTGGILTQARRQWVLVRVPFHAPTDSLGSVLVRRMRALRITMISSAAVGDQEFVRVPIDRLQLVGAPWLKRNAQTVSGVAGNQGAGGFVITSVIGTADKDSSTGLIYQSPPGITDQPDTRAAALAPTAVAVNEQSMRVLAGNLPLYGRAEAYYRSPAGQQNFMGYQELRLWARGRNHGWGATGELQMYVKMGRDENNFYMYRTPVASGQGQAAWLPEVRVDFTRFYALRNKLQSAYLGNHAAILGCTGLDSAMIAASGIPAGGAAHRYVACDGGYVVYTLEPGVTPPNLATVQELAVGFVRVAQGVGTAPIVPGDTLELWVDDIRLANVVSATGYAGQVGASLRAGDVGDLRIDLTRRDPNFRQLGEQPTFLDERSLEVGGTVHMEKLLPSWWNLALPLSVTHVTSTEAPQFLSGTDVQGTGIPDLRTPRDVLTSYNFVVRRSAPITDSPLAPLLNNLTASTTFADGNSRNEYSTGTSSHFNLGLDYLVADDPRQATLPDWMRTLLGAFPGFLGGGPIGALRDGTFRWNPSEIRLTSGIMRNNDRRSSFLQPTEATGDSASLSLALDQLWQNGATIEFRPTDALSARWDVVSVRDLRQYGDTTPQAVAASAERQRLLGVDVGMERQRSMQASIAFAPQISAWLKPRADFGTQYTLFRDPNASSLAQTQDSTGAYVLPARVNASQTLGAGVGVDVAKALAAYSEDTLLVRRLGHLFMPMDLGYSRSLLSALDGVPFNPSLGFQLGLGNVGGYRYVNGMPASTAGFTGTLSGTSGFNLPLGLSMIGRFRQTTNRDWVLRLDDTQAQVQGLTTTFPDVTARWNWRSTSHTGWVSSIAAGAGYSRTLATATLLTDADSTAPELRSARVYSYPVNASIAWNFGGLSTAGGYTLTTRLDSMPGSFARGRTEDVNLDIGRAFRVPDSWGLGLRSPVRARFGLQQSRASTYVYGDQGGPVSRLVDNGRSAFNLNADTDLSDAVMFTFQLSRVITYDNNLNRRLNEFVLSTVLQIQMSAGPLK